MRELSYGTLGPVRRVRLDARRVHLDRNALDSDRNGAEVLPRAALLDRFFFLCQIDFFLIFLDFPSVLATLHSLQPKAMLQKMQNLRMQHKLVVPPACTFSHTARGTSTPM